LYPDGPVSMDAGKFNLPPRGILIVDLK